MSRVRVLAFALFIVVQAASQDMSKVSSYTAPQEWKTNPFALFTAGRVARPDVVQMFPYPVPEDGPSTPPEQVNCTVSDGKTISVNYSTRHVKQKRPLLGDEWVTVFDNIIFVTDKRLTTAEAMSVPADDYTIAVPAHLRRVFLTLFMKRQKGGELRVPLSPTKLTLPAENSAISFQHTGGSCMMQIYTKNWDTQLSVEFTEDYANSAGEN